MSIGTILLLILKGIGILLLGLLGFLAALILLFLFLPFDYAGQGSFSGTLTAEGRIAWLFHVLGVRLYYDGARKEPMFRWQLRVLGIPLTDSLRRERKEALRRVRQKREGQKHRGQQETKRRQTPAEPIGEGKGRLQESAKALPEGIRQESAKASENGIGQKKTDETGKEKKKKGRMRFRKHICYTFRAICDKIKQIWENLSYYWDILQKEETKQAFSLCKKQLTGLVRHILPRQLRADFLLGTGDPASTGQLAACYGIAFPFIGDILELTPDFERKVFEGDFRLSGRITMFRILKTAWILYFDKNIRKLLHYLKKEEMEHV